MTLLYDTCFGALLVLLQLLGNWYSDADAEKKGVVMVVTTAKEGAVVGGNSFLQVQGGMRT
jgi:hypothetical protein